MAAFSVVRIGPGDVPLQHAERATLPVEQQGKMRGIEAVLARRRDQRAERMALDEPVQRVAIRLGE